MDLERYFENIKIFNYLLDNISVILFGSGKTSGKGKQMFDTLEQNNTRYEFID